MEVPKFKDVIQGVFKNYSSLLMPAVLGLVAVLLFVPTQLMSSKLRKQIADESISRRGRRVQSLSGSAVASEQYKEERKYQQAYRDDANEIALLVKQSTQRQLLSYEIFPEPKDISALIFRQFGHQFRHSVDGLLARLSARDCPTEIELERALEGLSKSSYRPGRRLGKVGGKGALYSRLYEARTTIVDVLCQEKAEGASVYANPVGLSGYEFWEEYEAISWSDAIEDCWYWQLGYWIIDDVVDTIAALNSGSNSVFTSPVKQLVSVSFPTSGKRRGFGYRSGRGSKVKVAEGRPKYVLTIEDALAWPCTGRFSNNDIDVVHFNVVVVVSTRAIMPFMQELCSAKQHRFRGWDGRGQEQVFKNNQITILESKVEPVDREDEVHKLYRYGEDAVVELNLVCEYIFNKAGYGEVKPKAVEESIEKVQKELAEKKAKAERKKRRRGKRKSETKVETGFGGKKGLPEVY